MCMYLKHAVLRIQVVSLKQRRKQRRKRRKRNRKEKRETKLSCDTVKKVFLVSRYYVHSYSFVMSNCMIVKFPFCKIIQLFQCSQQVMIFQCKKNIVYLYKKKTEKNRCFDRSRMCNFQIF